MERRALTKSHRQAAASLSDKSRISEQHGRALPKSRKLPYILMTLEHCLIWTAFLGHVARMGGGGGVLRGGGGWEFGGGGGVCGGLVGGICGGVCGDGVGGLTGRVCGVGDCVFGGGI